MAEALDELITWATEETHHHEDLVAARVEHRGRTGEVFDDDRQLEARLLAFLEWYVCERPAPWLQGRTPAVARYHEALQREGPLEAARFLALTCTVRALFEVRSVSSSHLVLRDLMLGIEYEVHSALVAAAVGDVVEARLVPQPEGWRFGAAPCWHPRVAAPLLVAEAHRRRAHGGAASPSGLADEAAQRSLKADRYRQVALERIYDFKSPHATKSVS
jgi:hypothetical protein